MKITKMKFSIILLLLALLLGFIGLISYSIGGHAASLTVKEVTPMQLAEAMQGDHFYSDFPTTMLLMQGTVNSINRQNNDTVVEFMTASSPSILPKVSCDLGNKQVSVKVGDAITVLSVAYDALRKNTADVFLQNCYLFKK